jgi:ssDNA-binding Zn-finger/Zn-ribbon topoisomerase 1
MRLEAYRCDCCETEVEELFNDTEDRPEMLPNPCPKCGGELHRWGLKNNQHRSYVQDRSVK